MARITIEDCLDNIPNRFSLVLLSAKRARQLRDKATPTLESKNKECVTALREAAHGHLRFRATPPSQMTLSNYDD